MVRSLRRYLKNRGSAMFMVLTSMTALMVSCMAMYFAVVSSRDTQYAVFNQQQSYQSAISIVDGIVAGLTDLLGGGSNVKDPTFKKSLEDLQAQMTKMEPGDVITTSDNGFAAFAALNDDGTVADGKKEDEWQIGSYAIDITRLADQGADYKVWDIAITSSVNGSTSAYHLIYRVPTKGAGKVAVAAPMKIVQATGYIPLDSSFGKTRFASDVYSDCEYTYLHPYGTGGEMQFTCNFAAKGSVIVEQSIQGNFPAAVDWAIGKDLYWETNEPLKTKDGTRIFVGGNLYAHDPNGCFNNGTKVYVLGDLYTKGGQALRKAEYYVQGNVYVEGWGAALDKVHCNGSVIINEGGVDNAVAGTWDSAAGGNTLSIAEAKDIMRQRLIAGKCPKWEVDPAQVPGLDSDPNTSALIEKEVGIGMGATKKENFLDFNGAHRNITLTYDNDHKGCTVRGVSLSDLYNSSVNLIIDTGIDPDNTFVIRVEPYIDTDGDGAADTFSWNPGRDDMAVCVLLKGAGSIVIDIPKGCTYLDRSNTKVMHWNFARLGGYNPNVETNIGSFQGFFNESFAKEMRNTYIHTQCGKDCCTYTLDDTIKNTCPACSTDEDPVYLVAYTCATHGVRSQEFCPKCQKDAGFVQWKSDGVPYGICQDHLDANAVISALSGMSDLDMMGSGIVCPTTNIFLVSCDESADIRLSTIASGKGHSQTYTSVDRNSFFGFIYAPYMTLRGLGSASGYSTRLVGGFNVANYEVEDEVWYVPCWPTHWPNGIMVNQGSEMLDGFGGEWKVDISY